MPLLGLLGRGSMYEMAVALRPCTTSRRTIAAQRKGNDTEEGIPPQRPPTHKEDTFGRKSGKRMHFVSAPASTYILRYMLYQKVANAPCKVPMPHAWPHAGLPSMRLRAVTLDQDLTLCTTHRDTDRLSDPHAHDASSTRHLGYR